MISGRDEPSGVGSPAGPPESASPSAPAPRHVRFVELLAGIIVFGAAGLGFAALGGAVGLLLVVFTEAAALALLSRWSVWE